VSALLKKETMVFNEIFSDYVVKCFWMFSDNINYYYVMEYMPGGNLLNFLNKYIPKNEVNKFIQFYFK
jgi:serine/threonine protein kinase